jgi:hypothetical protein
MANDKAVMGRAFSDARTLLIHVQRKGVDVDPPIVKAVLEFGDAYSKDAQTVEQEEKLLLALAALAKLARPASIDGIEATDFQATKGYCLLKGFLNCITFGRFPKTVQMPPIAFKSSLVYAALAMGTLVVLLLLLLSTTTQLALFQTLRQTEAEIATAEAALSSGAQALAAIDNELKPLVTSSPQYGPLASKRSQQKELNDKLGKEITDANETWAVTVDVLLSDRASIWYLLSSPLRLLGTAEKPDLQTEPVASDLRKYTFTLIRLRLIERLAFYVPALAAYLGALAYALRGIAREIVEDSFTEESRIQYRLRSTLAPLLGIAAGMMAGSRLIPSEAAPLQQVVDSTVGDTITIAVLAVQFTIGFVAGYSIEVVFSIVDNIISGFKK